jgi:hypothetical protein
MPDKAEQPKNTWTVRKCVMTGATPSQNRVEYQLIVNGTQVVHCVKEESQRQLQAMADDYTRRNVPPPDHQKDCGGRVATTARPGPRTTHNPARSAGLES